MNKVLSSGLRNGMIRAVFNYAVLGFLVLLLFGFLSTRF